MSLALSKKNLRMSISNCPIFTSQNVEDTYACDCEKKWQYV